MQDDSGDLSRLAAEFVLGTLPPAERASLRDRIERDSEFAELVQQWSDRLAPLADDIPPINPPKRVWEQIQSALPDQVPSGGDVFEDFERQARSWRRTAAVAAAACLALAVYVVYTLSPGVPRPRADLLALLGGQDAQPAILVSVDRTDHVATVYPLTDVGNEGKSLQLWLIGTDQIPRSLGLIDTAAVTAVSLPVDGGLSSSALAVSLEPEGGSPSGSPTGPVLYSGALVKTPE